MQGAAKAIEFYKNAFGATERMGLPTPDGKVAHAEIEIGSSVIMLADECPEEAQKARTLSAARRFAFTFM